MTVPKQLHPKESAPSLSKKEEAAARLKIQREKDRENVKGVFRFYEVPGGRMEFVYLQYEGDELEKYDMIDGQVYNIPLGVAKHLNKNGAYPVHVHTQDEVGKPSMKIGTKVRRFGFQSLEFVDIEDFPLNAGKELITVEYAG